MMYFILKRQFILFLSILLLLITNTAFAGDPPLQTARLSHITGQIVFAPAGQEHWVKAQINRPLIAGDWLYSNLNSKAKFQLPGMTAYIAQDTSVKILNLNDKITQLKVAQGRLNLHITTLKKDQSLEINTPNLALKINKPGVYKIQVNPKKLTTAISILKGSAFVYGKKGVYQLKAVQALLFSGTQLKYQPIAVTKDEFDKWSQLSLKKSKSVHYVSSDVIGYEDLDTYGTWVISQKYGPIWTPNNINSHWAPYQDGHWAWVKPWGWTWIDNQPWGFAPFHYGRWVQDNHHWYWVPAPKKAKAIYAPAMVAFVETGNKGQIAWFPLAPEDVYRPSYPVSKNYFVTINTQNSTLTPQTVTNVYVNPTVKVEYKNQAISNAVTAVPRTTFVESKPVAKEKVQVTAKELTQTPVQMDEIKPIEAPIEKAQKINPVIEQPVVVQSMPDKIDEPKAPDYIVSENIPEKNEGIAPKAEIIEPISAPIENAKPQPELEKPEKREQKPEPQVQAQEYLEEDKPLPKAKKHRFDEETSKPMAPEVLEKAPVIEESHLSREAPPEVSNHFEPKESLPAPIQPMPEPMIEKLEIKPAPPVEAPSISEPEPVAVASTPILPKQEEPPVVDPIKSDPKPEDAPKTAEEINKD